MFGGVSYSTLWESLPMQRFLYTACVDQILVFSLDATCLCEDSLATRPRLWRHGLLRPTSGCFWFVVHRESCLFGRTEWAVLPHHHLVPRLLHIRVSGLVSTACTCVNYPVMSSAHRFNCSAHVAEFTTKVFLRWLQQRWHVVSASLRLKLSIRPNFHSWGKEASWACV